MTYSHPLRCLAALSCLTLAAEPRLTRAADAPATATSEPVDWHLLEPLWASPRVFGESVLFVQEAPDARPFARLLLTPRQIVKLARADGSANFTAGTDFEVNVAKRRIELPAGSRIPFLKADELFPPKGSPRSIERKADDPSRGVLFDNAHWFHDQQIEITYDTHDKWQGYRPAVATKSLGRTLGKLRNRQPITIGVSGDSISFGLNASGLTGAAPRQPIYPQLVADQLQATFDCRVRLVNRAIGGWNSGNGLADLDKLLAEKPDLVIVAYGMNDVGGRAPDAFRDNIAKMLERIHAAGGETEIILVATMLGNADWVHTPQEMFPKYRDALAALVAPEVALADLTTLWTDLLRQKRHVDLSGNGVNHPNDFGHRLYAQVILALLVEPKEQVARK